MLQIITLDKKNKWSQIVKSFKHFDVYYLPEYVEAYELHGDGTPILFYYNYNGLRALNVAMLRDLSKDPKFKEAIPENTYFDLSTPYGYGGFLLEGDTSPVNMKQLDVDYQRLCKENNIVSEFVRFHPVLENSEEIGEMYDVVKSGRTVTLDLESQEQIWNNFKSKNRNVIRKAKKAGIEIRWGNLPELIDTFIPMYKATMDKNGAEDYYYFSEEFFHHLQQNLKYNMCIFYACFEGEIVSMAMILFANQKIHYHLSASNPKYHKYSPSNLLLNEVANWGVENNFTKFHLGGGVSNEEDNLFYFKNSFTKGKNTRFSIGKKIFDQEKYNELVSLRKEWGSFNTESSYFPEYRQ